MGYYSVVYDYSIVDWTFPNNWEILFQEPLP